MRPCDQAAQEARDGSSCWDRFLFLAAVIDSVSLAQEFASLLQCVLGTAAVVNLFTVAMF